MSHSGFEHSFSQDPSGATVLTFKLTQSHVSDDFVMLVPIYIELGKGQVARLGRIGVKGNTTLERQVRLPRLPVKPRRAMIATWMNSWPMWRTNSREILFLDMRS